MAWQLAVRVYGQLQPSSGCPPTRALGLACCERMLSFAGQCISCAVLFCMVQRQISVLLQETDKIRNHIYHDLCTSRLSRQCWIHLLQHKSKRWFHRTKLETGYTIIWINPYDNSDQELVRAKHSKVLLLGSEEGHAAVHLNWSNVKNQLVVVAQWQWRLWPSWQRLIWINAMCIILGMVSCVLAWSRTVGMWQAES
jgi:hypothetical protein